MKMSITSHLSNGPELYSSNLDQTHPINHVRYRALIIRRAYILYHFSPAIVGSTPDMCALAFSLPERRLVYSDHCSKCVGFVLAMVHAQSEREFESNLQVGFVFPFDSS